MSINMGTWYYCYDGKMSWRQYGITEKMYVAVLVCVEAGKCYYMNGCLYNALKQACVIHKCGGIVISGYFIDSSL